ALSLARVSGPKRVTLALAGGVSPDEDAFSVEPPDAVRLRHSNSSTACGAILSSFPPSRNASIWPVDIKLRTWRSEHCHSRASVAGVSISGRLTWAVTAIALAYQKSAYRSLQIHLPRA